MNAPDGGTRAKEGCKTPDWCRVQIQIRDQCMCFDLETQQDIDDLFAWLTSRGLTPTPRIVLQVPINE